MGRCVVIVALIAACGGSPETPDDPCLEEVELTPCRWNGIVGVCVGSTCTPTVCGNGITDPGEDCDDGNRSNADGCRTDCTNPACSDGIVQVFEECDDGNKVDHDGCSRECQREPAVWQRVDQTPPPRSAAAMGYDPKRGVVVMFGGRGAAPDQILDDTWEWDGHHWTQIDTEISATARLGAKLVFDPRTGLMLMVGGYPAHWISVWAYTDRGWMPQDAGNDEVGAFGDHAAAWSGTLKKVVLAGGRASLGTGHSLALFGTMYDGWDPLTALPAWRVDHALVEDPVRGQLIMFSGRADASSPAVAEAWALDASGWRQLPAPPAPALHATGVFDPVTSRVLFYDGTTLTAWDGTAWSIINAPNAPPPLSEVSVAYDLRRHQLVVFGGLHADWTTNGDTYTFDGAWHRHEPPPPVSSLAGATAVWDPARGAGLVVGAKTWRSNGGLEEISGSGPTPRTTPAVAAVRDRLILTGGAAAADTWAWDGGWQRLAETGAPGLATAAMAQDSAGAVLFGGETWTYRDATWARVDAPAPAATGAVSLAFDPIRQRTVLNGGTTTTEWTGTSWELSSSIASPGEIATVYDPNWRSVLAVGKSGVFQYRSQGWARIPYVAAEPSAAPAAVYYDAIRRAVIYLEDTSPVRAWRFLYNIERHERCSPAVDDDADGLTGCADPDCWARCTPFCPPGTACDATLPRCGDGVCNSALESCDLCPQDCSCPTECGDYRCDPGEQCPGDC